MKTIAIPFGALLLWLYTLVGNYGIAIFLFALVVKIILLPFQMKSKKSMMRMTRFQPKLKELEVRHKGNQQAYQEAVAKLYRDEKINPMSGCLWSLIPFPLLIALYYAIRYPLTTMMGVPQELMAQGGAILAKLQEMGFESSVNAAYLQIAQSQFITEHFADFAPLSEKLIQLDYSFLGLNLGVVPQWNFFMKVNWSNTAEWLPQLGLFIIPLVSAVLSWVQMKVSQAMNPSTNDNASNQLKGMNLMMPIMSLWIGFSMPAALGIYWVATSVLAIIQDAILNVYYKRVMDKEDAERLEQENAREAELERKRQETEKLKAEGATARNTSTSKKKLQARQKQESEEVKAAAIREERRKRREMLGIPEEEIPESQVGNRRYARGRAYVADRYTNPETAEEKTAAAAAESEFGESIDESAEEAVVTEEVAAAAEETAEETAEAAEEAEAEGAEEQ